MDAKLQGALENIYQKQVDYQYKLFDVTENKENINIVLPKDVTDLYRYHITAIVEELGELMNADKRWKDHRNDKFDLKEKKAELADVFITVVNLAIFSGITVDELALNVLEKIEENNTRLEATKQTIINATST